MWDKTVYPALATLNPGDSVEVNFDFASLSASQLASVKNGTVTLAISVTGLKVGDSAQNDALSSTLTRSLKIQPQIDLIPRLVYSQGPFKNTGPVPPKADTKTTYTVMWTITGSPDDVSGLTVTAVLPSYVTWLGAVNPSTENITWNAEQNEVVWHVDDIPPGQAGAPAKEVDFQIAFTPSTSQKGIQPPPDVVQNMTYQATDSYTGATLSGTKTNLNTSLSTDPQFSSTSGIVQ